MSIAMQNELDKLRELVVSLSSAVRSAENRIGTLERGVELLHQRPKRGRPPKVAAGSIGEYQPNA